MAEISLNVKLNHNQPTDQCQDTEGIDDTTSELKLTLDKQDKKDSSGVLMEDGVTVIRVFKSVLDDRENRREMYGSLWVVSLIIFPCCWK